MSHTSTATAFRVGVETLRANPLRTILSTLGVVIGVASLVAVLAVGDGMERFGLESIEQEGMQTIVVRPDDGERIDGVFVPRTPTVTLGAADAADLAAALPAEADVAMRATAVGLVSADTSVRARGTQLVGILPGRMTKAPAIAHGRALSADDTRTDARVAVLSKGLADSLAAPRAAAALVGTDVRFSTGATFRVVGVAARVEGAERVNLVMVPIGALAAAAAPTGRAIPAGIEVRAPAIDQVATTKAAVERWAEGRYGERHRELRIAGGASERRIEQVRRGVLGFKLFMGAIVGISLVVGGIGIMNVLLASVTERTREIGIRKTTGARGRDILRQFLAESVVITGAGSAVGTLLGLATAFGATAVMRSVAQIPVHAAVTGWTLLIAVGVSVAVGLIFGTYPARRAARLSPIEAIRHE